MLFLVGVISVEVGALEVPEFLLLVIPFASKDLIVRSDIGATGLT